MSSRFIPRDKLSAAVPWQMGAFSAVGQETPAKRRNGLVDDVETFVGEGGELVHRAFDDADVQAAAVGFLHIELEHGGAEVCLLYTSDAADE